MIEFVSVGFMNWIIPDYQLKKKKQGVEAIYCLVHGFTIFYFTHNILFYFEELGVEIEYFCVTVA